MSTDGDRMVDKEMRGFGYAQIFEEALAAASAAPAASALAEQVATANLPLKPPRTSGRSRSLFLRGPIPLRWMTSAASISRGAALLGTALWFRLGITGRLVSSDGRASGSLVVRIDRQLRDQCGLKRWHITTGIQDLEEAGLISCIKCGRGHCPVVEVLVTAPERP